MATVPGTHESSSIAADYEALTRECGLVDRSERGKLALTGASAVEFLNGQVTNELAGIAPGEGRYAAFLTHKGKMLGDLRVLALGERATSELLLDTERPALQALFDMIRRYKVGHGVELHKRTLECALLSLVGPRARSVALAAARLQAEELPAAEHAHRPARIAGARVRLVSVHDGGLDVLLEAADREAVWSALCEAGAREVSAHADEIVRVERGLPRYGIDLDETTIPQEAGLNERAVSFTKGCYVGQETVARLYYRGKPNRHLRGVRLAHEVCAGAEISFSGRRVGTITSAVRSPALGPIALAMVRREAQPGATVLVGEDGVAGEVISPPFSPLSR